MLSVHSTLRFDASQCLVGRQFEFADLRIRQASDAIAETRFRDGPHLKGQCHRGLRRTILGSFDNGRPRESRPVEVRGQRNDKNGLEHAGQGFALPDYDGRRPVCSRGRYGPRSAHQISPRFTVDPHDRAPPPSRRDPALPAARRRQHHSSTNDQGSTGWDLGGGQRRCQRVHRAAAPACAWGEGRRSRTRLR